MEMNSFTRSDIFKQSIVGQSSSGGQNCFSPLRKTLPCQILKMKSCFYLWSDFLVWAFVVVVGSVICQDFTCILSV